MAKSNVSRETRIAAGIAAVCAVACILYSRAASRVGMAGLVTYAASAASMVLAAVLLGGVCAVLAGMVLRDAWAKGPDRRLDFSYKEAFEAERPVLLCAALEVAGVVGVWALGIAVSGFLPYGAIRMVLVAGVAMATIAWVVLVWRTFRALWSPLQCRAVARPRDKRRNRRGCRNAGLRCVCAWGRSFFMLGDRRDDRTRGHRGVDRRGGCCEARRRCSKRRLLGRSDGGRFRGGSRRCWRIGLASHRAGIDRWR